MTKSVNFVIISNLTTFMAGFSLRIRSHIFISVFLATVLPMVTLALSATYYSEKNYQGEVKREIFTSLNGLANEIRHELQNSHNLVLGISRAAALKAFLPVLSAVAQDKTHSNIRVLRRKVNHYFEGFQTILPGSFIMRVLDKRGDTLVKVSHNKISQPQYESLQGIHYVEHQIATPDFIETLEKLPPDEVNMLTLPHHLLENENYIAMSLLDYIVPFYKNGHVIGALAVTLSGEQIDHIIANIPRLYKGSLFMAENNPDDDARHGLLLYDEDNKLSLSQLRSTFIPLKLHYDIPLLNEINNTPEGLITVNKSHNYYTELFPYPDRLISWLITMKINTKTLSAPFTEIRYAIWLFAATSLFVTLLLIAFAVRKISEPVCVLASQLKSFADGKHELRANTEQTIDEIKILADSFNYMADTLINAQQERDKAQSMVLQNNKLASIGQMAAGIGHEINNPLNNILSYSTLISRNITKNTTNLSAKNQQCLQQDINALRDETLRASQIIKDLLNFARQMPPQLKEFSVNDWIKKSISLIQHMANEKHITINFKDKKDVMLEGDQAQLQQVMINLMLNAIQSSEQDSLINITIKTMQDRIDIQIHDQGSGIADDQLDKIYDPFFTTKTEGEGSGLGLSISLGIIELHHGSLIIQNNPGRGISATIMLPLHAHKNKRDN